MRNKRGFIFGLILVFVTLFLSASVVLLYGVSQRNSDSSLVSPKSVLEMRDDLELFEMREVELIKSSLVKANGVFESKEFSASFWSIFLDGVMADGKMKKFLFDDLFIDGVEMDGQVEDRNLLERIYLVSDDLSFYRRNIEKGSLLTAKDEIKIEFPVYFTFEFEREYLISKVGSKFEVDKK